MDALVVPALNQPVVGSLHDREAEVVRVPQPIEALAVRKGALKRAVIELEERPALAIGAHNGKVVDDVDRQELQPATRTVGGSVFQPIGDRVEAVLRNDVVVRHCEPVGAHQEPRAERCLLAGGGNKRAQLQKTRPRPGRHAFGRRWGWVGGGLCRSSNGPDRARGDRQNNDGQSPPDAPPQQKPQDNIPRGSSTLTSNLVDLVSRPPQRHDSRKNQLVPWPSLRCRTGQPPGALRAMRQRPAPRHLRYAKWPRPPGKAGSPDRPHGRPQAFASCSFWATARALSSTPFTVSSRSTSSITATGAESP